MDIILERILSLLPHKEDGKIVRGAKKEFAQSIGYDSGDIISMWVNGSSTSYKGKVHEISAKYNVSVDWLLGKTDQKEQAPAINESLSDPVTAELLKMVREASEEERRDMLDLLRIVQKRREKE